MYLKGQVQCTEEEMSFPYEFRGVTELRIGVQR